MESLMKLQEKILLLQGSQKDAICEVYDKFMISKEKLCEISGNFIASLDQGLTLKGGSIPMNASYIIGYPTGKEKGMFLTLDMGGTNFRVCEVQLHGDGTFSIQQSKHKILESEKVGDYKVLFKKMALAVKEVIHNSTYHIEKSEIIPLGFTFSYPVTHVGISKGVLQHWTKGFDLDHTEGHEISELFNKALEETQTPSRVSALLNDTVGTLIGSHYADKKFMIGCILGTGCNAAYTETCDKIPKLDSLKLPEKLEMSINCEWGAFDNEKKYLPRTKYDISVDLESPRPGLQIFEKMCAGRYLGEIFRKIILDFASRGNILQSADLSSIKKAYTVDTADLSLMEEDEWPNLPNTKLLWSNTFSINLTNEEAQLFRVLSEIIGIRSAHLSHCGISAIIKKRKFRNCYVAADGSLFSKYPFYKERGAEALKMILGDEWGSTIDVRKAVDGSSVGAAVAAALASRNQEIQQLKDL